jgi:hypothetical protein
MHGLYDVKLAEVGMRNLAVLKQFRDDAGDFTTGLQDGIGECPHQPDACTAVNNSNIVLDRNRPKALAALI